MDGGSATANRAAAEAVAVLRDLESSARCPVRVESAVSGYSWRERDARLEHLARWLGHRIAEGL